jgi:hypothetical protein
LSVETIVAAALTFMVWSYVLGDNPAFRVAEHLLVGTAAGYAAVVAWHNVLQPAAQAALIPQPSPLAGVPLVLCVLLAARVRPAWSGWSGVAVAFLVGVGSGLAVGGALFGTLWSQISATAGLSLDPADYGDLQPALASPALWQNLAILIGTVGALFYFAFNTRPGGPLGGLRGAFTRFWSGVGLWIIMMALGALFANAAMSRFTLLIGRVQWLLEAVGLV